MQTERLNQLLAEMKERRELQQNYAQQVRQSAFTFTTGLSNIKRNIEETAMRFIDLTGQISQCLDSDATIVPLHRRAS